MTDILVCPPDTYLDTFHNVDTVGYGVLSTVPDYQSLSKLAVEFGQHISANHIGSMEISGEGSDTWLLKHTESIIFDEATLLKYFALGSIIAAKQGGATVIYDGREIASKITSEYPELTNVKTKYVSTVYAGQVATHSLVNTSEEYGAVVRYRSPAVTNLIGELPEGMSEEEYYHIVESTVEDSVLTVHDWQPGELLIVNNHITLHSRQPYTGHRRMARFRYDDPYHQTILVPEREIS